MENIILMQQVHGNNVVIVGKKDIGTTIPNCDAMITNEHGVTLGVRVADCLPIMVTDEKGRGIGLIHAGWRGLENGIIGSTLLLMQKKFKINNKQSLAKSEFGEELKIKIGPHICENHYEVKENVFSKFSLYFKGSSFKGGRTFLDLAEVARQQFVKLGVKSENITIDPTCTFENKKLFSFRQNGTDKRSLYLLKI